MSDDNGRTLLTGHFQVLIDGNERGTTLIDLVSDHRALEEAVRLVSHSRVAHARYTACAEYLDVSFPRTRLDQPVPLLSLRDLLPSGFQPFYFTTFGPPPWVDLRPDPHRARVRDQPVTRPAAWPSTLRQFYSSVRAPWTPCRKPPTGTSSRGTLQ